MPIPDPKSSCLLAPRVCVVTVLPVLRTPVAQTCSLSVSLEIVAAREDFFLTTDGHGLTRMKTPFLLSVSIRVHPWLDHFWLRLRRAALYRRVALCQTSAHHGACEQSDALPITKRRYGRLKICATVNRDSRVVLAVAIAALATHLLIGTTTALAAE